MNGVRFQKLRSLIWVGLCIAACLIVVACNKTGASKKLSPVAVRQMQLDWNLKTLVESYQEIGETDPQWDEPARRALTEFARTRSQATETNEPWAQIIATNCDAAVKAGCDDSMIAYLYARFSLDQTNSSRVFANAFLKAAQDMQQSSYPSIRKFYAWHRAGQQVIYTYGYGTNIPPEISQIGIWNSATTNLQDAISNKTMPPEEVYQACHVLLEIWKGSKEWYDQLYQSIRPRLDENWPNESAVWLLKGEAYIEMAWHARGSGYANTVTKEEWKAFGDHLKTAQKALEKAWNLNPKDPRIATTMLTLELGQGKGRDRMELWFNRAMKLDPNNYDACYKKLYYLEPKWYGSREAMLDFGRECVQNTNWAGRVPLVLADAHWGFCLGYIDKSEQTNYWKQPDVWPDIKSAYDRFFELNPDATGYYHNYAWYAYKCEQWDKLNELIPKLGPVNYAYFGGEDEFNKMVQLAKEHADKPK